MIRILQQNNKATKVLFAIIIGAAVVTMVITLVPGIFDNVGGGGGDATTFATVHQPGVFGRLFGGSETVGQQEVSRTATQMVQQQFQGRQIPPMYLQIFQKQAETQAGQQLVDLAILKIEGDRRGLQVSDDDLAKVLHQGQLGQVIFPNGVYIGDDKYMDLISNQLGMTTKEFEAQIKKEVEQGRLQSMITGGVTVSDNEVRESFKTSGTKVKFDYAVLSSDDISKTVNPSDADLQKFFKDNAPRYATAVGETRKLDYFSFGADQLPGGKPAVSDADVQSYYAAHAKDYTVPDQVKARHILIGVPAGSDAKVDAAAKAKAEDILKQIKTGGDFVALAKANSTDPGSKDSGGELGTFGKGKMVPEFEAAAFSLQPGQTSEPVKTSFGYHLIQVESKDTAHTKPLAEVKPTIVPILEQQKLGAAEQAYANSLTDEAKKNGLDKTAAAHNLRAITTDYLGKDGVVGGVADSTAMLSQAFAASKGGPPASVSTGDGYAVFQVLDVKAPHAPVFDQYKTKLTADYREQQVPQLLNAQLNKLAARAKELGDLHKAAAELNIPVKTSDLVGKDGQVPDLGAMSGPANVAFTMAKGAISGPLNTGRIGSVLEVTDKQEPSTDEIAKNFTPTREAMLGAKRQEVFNLYLGTLVDKYKKANAIRYKTPLPVAPTPAS